VQAGRWIDMRKDLCTKPTKKAGLKAAAGCAALAAALTLLLAQAVPALAGNATLPGAISTPYPTLTNLAVEWLIEGDDNLNATVAVEYRMAGETRWRKAMPLVRVPADNTGDRTWPTFRWDNKFSGSILDLKPGTPYEIHLSLKDLDGGAADTTLRVSTRPVPKAAADGTVKKVNPDTFNDIMACAQPGDILLLAPGYYEEPVPFRDGEPGRPIVIRSDRSHPVINATFDSVDLQGRRHVILEGVTVRGSVNLRSAEDITVRRCTVNARYGIIAKNRPGCRNCYIADNTVSYVMPWVREGMGSSAPWGGGANEGEGIEITGPGNVVCFNRVSGYRDCISFMEDLWVHDQICIDFYNNDISVGADDGIEADFAMNNCRIMRNRIANCGMGLSSQPGLGGPTYFIRNVMYNLTGAPFKLERYSVGNIFLHNTCVKMGDGFIAPHWQNEYFRTVWENNLCIGGGQWDKLNRRESNIGRAVFLPGFNSTCFFDYNAAGAHGTPFAGQVDRKKFTDLEGLRKATGGPHSIQVDLDVFAARVEFPDPPVPARDHADLRLASGSAPVDAGVVIPNVNDGFKGKAPDIGAYELGDPLPVYGPRPEGVDEETMWLESNPQ
jgi:hypothetical protein